MYKFAKKSLSCPNKKRVRKFFVFIQSFLACLFIYLKVSHMTSLIHKLSFFLGVIIPALLVIQACN